MIASVKAAPNQRGRRTTKTKPGWSVTRRQAMRGKGIAMAKSIGAAALVFTCMISTAWAQNSCVKPQDMAALQTATVQQRFMVAALTCDAAQLYNGFVRGYH